MTFTSPLSLLLAISMLSKVSFSKNIKVNLTNKNQIQSIDYNLSNTGRARRVSLRRGRRDPNELSYSLR